MAHPYDTEANLKLLMGSDLTDELLDHDDDGLVEAGHYDAVREEADREIDARLAQKYTVPFDTVPDLIKTLSNYLTAALLFVKDNPNDPRIEFYAGRANQLLDGLLDGTYELPGATKVGPDKRSEGLKYEASTPVFGGVDSSSNRRTKGW